MSDLEKADALLTWGPLVVGGVVGLAAHRWLGTGLVVTGGIAVGSYVITRKVIEAEIRKRAAETIEGQLGSFFARAKKSVAGVDGE